MPVNDKTWMEWSHKVLEELVTLNARVESLDEKNENMRKRIEERYLQIEAKLEKTNELLNGNGSPEKGLVVRVDRLEMKDVEDLDVRVDRLEQIEVRRILLIRAMIVTFIGTIGATIASWIKRT